MADEIRVDAYGAGAATRGPLLRRTAWGAIFAGTFVALSCQLLLGSLGLAIGAATVNPAREMNPAEGLGVGAGIWLLVSALISLFAGGLVTSWLAGFPRMWDGMIHGLVVWGLTVALSAWLVTTSAASFAGGALGTLNTAMSQPASSDSPLGALRERASEAIDNSQNQSNLPPDVRQTLRREIGSARNISNQERQRAVQTLTNEHGMPRYVAEDMVNEYLNTQSRGGSIYGSPEDRDQAAQGAANLVTNAATWTFFAILLGLAAAAAGGAIGRPQYLIDDRRVVV
jgi:hypothetical protein